MSRAEDLPEEILDRILFFVGNDSYHSSGGVVNKEGLCSCSLTCRYWSQRTIPALFDTIGLRSPEDVKKLCSLVKTSPRKIAPHIRALHIVQSDDGVHPPWIHQVLLNTAHTLPNLCEMIYSDAETRPKIHPHPLLPTRLPVFFGSVSGLKDLWLLDQHFHSFTDIMHVLNRLPLLETLSCGRLTWTHQPHRMPASRGRNPNRLSTVHLLSSKAIWPIAWLFTAPAASSRAFNEHPRDMCCPSLTLDEGTATVINDVIQCFLSHEKMESSTFRLERANQSMCTFSQSVSYDKLSILMSQ